MSKFFTMGHSSPLNFPEVLRLWRERSGLSGRALSSACGVSASYVSKVESGSMTPPADVFAKMAQHLNLSDPEVLFLLGLLSKNRE